MDLLKHSQIFYFSIFLNPCGHVFGTHNPPVAMIQHMSDTAWIALINKSKGTTKINNAPKISKLFTISAWSCLAISKKELFKVIVNELNKIKEKFSVKRRTKIIDAVLNYNIEETIQKEAVVITITHKGYIKRGSLSSVKIQKRGGKGKIQIEFYSDSDLQRILDILTDI